MEDIDEDIDEDSVAALADAGILIEAGWQSLKQMVLYRLDEDEDDAEFTATRLGFVCGARHVFFALMNLSREGDTKSEVTRRLESIHDEVDRLSALLLREVRAAKQ